MNIWQQVIDNWQQNTVALNQMQESLKSIKAMMVKMRNENINGDEDITDISDVFSDDTQLEVTNEDVENTSANCISDVTSTNEHLDAMIEDVDKVSFEETVTKRSYSCWENFESKSQPHMDNMETALLAMADTTVITKDGSTNRPKVVVEGQTKSSKKSTLLNPDSTNEIDREMEQLKVGFLVEHVEISAQQEEKNKDNFHYFGIVKWSTGIGTFNFHSIERGIYTFIFNISVTSSFECFELYGIPVPRYALVNWEEPYQELDYFIEDEDFVEVHGQRFWKPFVEKSVHGDDLHIMIYYPSAAGGGMKELFRKVGNRSSEFIEPRSQDQEGSVERTQDVHHIELFRDSMGTKCITQAPLLQKDEIIHGQYKSEGEEQEVQEVSIHLDPFETSINSLFWQEGASQVEEWQGLLTLEFRLKSSRGSSTSKGMFKNSKLELSQFQKVSSAIRESDKIPITRGSSCGLIRWLNFGNTCFMNNAIQCLVHTPEFATYFRKEFQQEIKCHNSLDMVDMVGELALAIGGLIRKVWDPGWNPLVSRQRKAKFVRFAPQSSGYNQHKRYIKSAIEGVNLNKLSFDKNLVEVFANGLNKEQLLSLYLRLEVKSLYGGRNVMSRIGY